jgi:hypothetical protein
LIAVVRSRIAISWGTLKSQQAAYGKVGQTEEELTVLAEALAFVDKTGERVHETELYRLKGELIFQSHVASHQSKVEDAEACCIKASDIARRQQAND